MAYSLLTKSCGQLLTLASAAAGPLTGPSLTSWRSLQDGYVACENDRIVAVGTMRELDVPTAEEISCWLGENPVRQVVIGGQLV